MSDDLIKRLREDILFGVMELPNGDCVFSTDSYKLTEAICDEAADALEAERARAETAEADAAHCHAEWMGERTARMEANNREHGLEVRLEAAEARLAEALEVIRDLDAVAGEEHERLCQGREYVCACGLDDRICNCLARTAAFLAKMAPQRG